MRWFALLFLSCLFVVSPASASTRIINADSSSSNIPYQLGITINEGEDNLLDPVSIDEPLCSASLIKPTVAITAAHCIIGDIDVANRDNDAWVFGGTISLSNPTSNLRGARIIRVYIHPTLDLAVLSLDRPMTTSPSISPVALPAASQMFAPGENNVLASGWGKINQSQGSDKLRSVRLGLHSDAYCAKQYDEPTKSKFLQYTALTHLCAGGREDGRLQGTRPGDSGGPLVDIATGLLIGVASYAGSSDTEDVPSGYVEVANPDALDWINRASSASIAPTQKSRYGMYTPAPAISSSKVRVKHASWVKAGSKITCSAASRRGYSRTYKWQFSSKSSKSSWSTIRGARSSSYKVPLTSYFIRCVAIYERDSSTVKTQVVSANSVFASHPRIQKARVSDCKGKNCLIGVHVPSSTKRSVTTDIIIINDQGVVSTAKSSQARGFVQKRMAVPNGPYYIMVVNKVGNSRPQSGITYFF